jgi:hypothetical protein
LSIHGDSLAVSQSPPALEQIGALLEAYRRATHSLAAESTPSRRVFLLDPEESETIHSALGKPVDLFILGETVAALPGLIEPYLGFPVRLDERTVHDELGDPGAIGISNLMPQLPLRSVLGHVLREHDLAWGVRDGAVIIAPRHQESVREIRVYQVTDLIERTIEESLFNAGLPGDGEQALREMVTSQIATDDWNDYGGPCAILSGPQPGLLAVSQLPGEHDRIGRLFAQMRKAAASKAERSPIPAREPLDEKTPLIYVYSLPEPPPPPATRPAAAAAIPPNVSPQFGGTASAPICGGSLFMAASPIPGEDMVEIIRNLVKPQSWRQDDVYIKAVPGRLIVRHVPEAHREIARLFGKLGLATWSPSSGGL